MRQGGRGVSHPRLERRLFLGDAAHRANVVHRISHELLEDSVTTGDDAETDQADEQDDEGEESEVEPRIVGRRPRQHTWRAWNNRYMRVNMEMNWLLK